MFHFDVSLTFIKKGKYTLRLINRIVQYILKNLGKYIYGLEKSDYLLTQVKNFMNFEMFA